MIQEEEEDRGLEEQEVAAAGDSELPDSRGVIVNLFLDLSVHTNIVIISKPEGTEM